MQGRENIKASAIRIKGTHWKKVLTVADQSNNQPGNIQFAVLNRGNWIKLLANNLLSLDVWSSGMFSNIGMK